MSVKENLDPLKGSQSGAEEMTMHGHQTTIRLVTIGDVTELTRLYIAYRVFYGEPPADDAALAFIRDRIERNAGQYFLAWSETSPQKSPVAFMHLMSSTNTLAMRLMWFLEDLYVEPLARNQGIATSLLRHAEDFARSTGAERLTLATAHDNHTAQSIYRKLGYIREDHFFYFHRVL
jgi:GNAT superfamily N-acetyltransferase